MKIDSTSRPTIQPKIEQSPKPIPSHSHHVKTEGPIKSNVGADIKKDTFTTMEKGKNDFVQLEQPKGVVTNEDNHVTKASNLQGPATARDIALAKGTQKEGKQQVLDLKKPITPQVLQKTIDFLADDRGESGKLSFNLEGEARVGAVGKIGGLLDLDIGVSKTDTGATVLSMDYEAAVKAGLDLKFFEVDGKVGANGKIKARFNSSKDAANWLTEQFGKIAEKTHGFINVPKTKIPYNKPTQIEEQGYFASVHTKADFGKFSIEGEARREAQKVTYRTPDGQVYHGSNKALTLSGDVNFEVGNLSLKGKYTFEESTVKGDPVSDNNGHYRNHKVSFEINGATAKGMNRKKIEDLVLKGFGITEKMAPGKTLKGLNYKAFSKMVDKIEDAFKHPDKNLVDGKISLSFETNEVEENGQYNPQYYRLKLNTSATLAKVGTDNTPIKSELSLNRSRVISEWAGSKTETYASQIYKRARVDGKPNEDWQNFKANNRPVLESLIKQRPENDPVRQAYEQKGYDAGLKALEQSWETDLQKEKAQQRIRARIDRDVNKIIANLDKYVGGDDEVIMTLKKYQGLPKQLAQIFDALQKQGYDRDVLLDDMNSIFSRQNYDEMKVLLDRARPYRKQ